jgi:hypothetical protein
MENRSRMRIESHYSNGTAAEFIRHLACTPDYFTMTEVKAIKIPDSQTAMSDTVFNSFKFINRNHMQSFAYILRLKDKLGKYFKKIKF